MTSPPHARTHLRLDRRRALQLGLGAGALVAGTTAPARATATPPEASSLAGIEQRYDVTLGAYAVNLRTGERLTHRAGERFPLLSTFKGLAVAAVLRGRDDLDHVVRYRPADVVVNSPITSQRTRMTVGELCDAALRFSDNTAGNLLLARIGGPAGVTRFARSIGDRTSRLDRTEPTLNTAIPGDVRDTTTPAALAASYRTLLLGDALATRDRWLLRAWMQGNTTSGQRFRAGLPTGWTLADKTGGGDYATQNDVGVAVHPDGTTLVVAAQARTDDATRTADPAVLADVFRLVVDRLGPAAAGR